MMANQNWTKLHVFDTVQCADTVEWCQIEPCQHILACGTYQNIENEEITKRNRVGSILLFSVDEASLEQIDKVETPAILDLKWCPKKINKDMMLAAATSAGEILIISLVHQKLILKMKKNLNEDKLEEDFLVLSLEWSKHKEELCASDSNGNISILSIVNDELVFIKNWNAHSLEAWTACFDSTNQNILYSGGDDCKLNVWDTREEATKIAASSAHNAGVTSLLSITGEQQLISGSYDENYRFWDCRHWKHPVFEIPASGGVWRLKLHPKTRIILAACVYGGFQILDIRNEPKVTEHYREHASLAYGADWSAPSGDFIACCSFYDHKLSVSVVKNLDFDENLDFI